MFRQTSTKLPNAHSKATAVTEQMVDSTGKTLAAQVAKAVKAVTAKSIKKRLF